MQPGHEGGFEVVRGRDEHGLDAGAGQRVREHQGAGNGTHGAVEAELAQHTDAVEASGRELVLAEHQREGDRELETGAGLAHGARGRG